MANSLGTSVIALNDDSSAVDLGRRKVKAIWFHSDNAGTCTLLDAASGNPVFKAQVDGSTKFCEGIYLGGVDMNIYLTKTSGLTGTNATVYIYLA